MPKLETFAMEKQSESQWCWLATTASVYNFWLRRKGWDDGHQAMSAKRMFELVRLNTEYSAKYTKGGRDFPGKPKACLEAVDCFARDGQLKWPKDIGQLPGTNASTAPLNPSSDAFKARVLDAASNRDQLQRQLDARAELMKGRERIVELMKQEINGARPVVCGFGSMAGGTGHAMVMIGYEGNELIFKDPMKGDDEEPRFEVLQSFTTRSGKEAILRSVCFTKAPELDVVKSLDSYLKSL